MNKEEKKAKEDQIRAYLDEYNRQNRPESLAEIYKRVWMEWKGWWSRWNHRERREVIVMTFIREKLFSEIHQDERRVDPLREMHRAIWEVWVVDLVLPKFQVDQCFNIHIYLFMYLFMNWIAYLWNVINKWNKTRNKEDVKYKGFTGCSDGWGDRHWHLPDQPRAELAEFP